MTGFSHVNTGSKSAIKQHKLLLVLLLWTKLPDAPPWVLGLWGARSAHAIQRDNQNLFKK